MQVKDGKVDGCGWRVLATAMPDSLPGTAMALDTSFNIYANGMHLLKGGAVRFRLAADGSLIRQDVRPISSFWLKTGSASPSSPTGPVSKSDSPKGYLLYVSQFERALDFFSAVADGAEILIGVRVVGEDMDRILAGTVEATDDEKRQVGECLKGLSSSVEPVADGARK